MRKSWTRLIYTQKAVHCLGVRKHWPDCIPFFVLFCFWKELFLVVDISSVMFSSLNHNFIQPFACEIHVYAKGEQFAPWSLENRSFHTWFKNYEEVKLQGSIFTVTCQSNTQFKQGKLWFWKTVVCKLSCGNRKG